MPHRLFTSALSWTIAGSFALFLLLRWALPEAALIQFLNYALILVAFALTLGYMPEVVVALRERRFGMLGLFAAGVGIVWLAILVNRSWALLERIVGAEWMRTSPVISVYLFIFVLGGLLQLIAPGVIEGRVPRRNMIKLGLVLGGAIVASLFVWSIGYGDTGFG